MTVLFIYVVAFTGGTEVDNGPLVIFAVAPVGKLELAKGDEAPVGRMSDMVELVAAGMPGAEVKDTVILETMVVFAGGGVGTLPLPVTVGKAPVVTLAGTG